MDNSDILENLNIILDKFSELSPNEIRRLLNKMSSSEIAHVLESSPPKQRQLKRNKFVLPNSQFYLKSHTFTFFSDTCTNL